MKIAVFETPIINLKEGENIQMFKELEECSLSNLLKEIESLILKNNIENINKHINEDIEKQNKEKHSNYFNLLGKLLDTGIDITDYIFDNIHSMRFILKANLLYDDLFGDKACYSLTLDIENNKNIYAVVNLGHIDINNMNCVLFGFNNSVLNQLKFIVNITNDNEEKLIIDNYEDIIILISKLFETDYNIDYCFYEIDRNYLDSFFDECARITIPKSKYLNYFSKFILAKYINENL